MTAERSRVLERRGAFRGAGLVRALGALAAAQFGVATASAARAVAPAGRIATTTGDATTAHRLAPAPMRWVASWASSQQVPEARNALPQEALRDATLRETVHLSVGASALRIRFSNAFGTGPLYITAAHLARPVSPASGAIDVSTDRQITFGGKADVTIPAGAVYLSDPIALPAAPQSDLVVSFHLSQPPARETGHPGSRETSFVARGDRVADAKLAGAMPVDH